MEEVIILPELEDKLFDLVTILYKENYFSFLESSLSYVDNIVNFIYTIPTLQFKEAANKKFGKYYCSYKANRNTTWYITFDKQDERFIIQYITNNHTEEYPYFISKIK